MHETVRTAFPAFSEPLEGRLNFMYLDIKSLVSTGVGNLLDADDPEHFGTRPVPLADIFTLDWSRNGVPAGREEIEEEYRRVKFSGMAHATVEQKRQFAGLHISEAAIDALVTRKLDAFETGLRRRQEFGQYDGWPADGQLGLLSMAWAMGDAFRGFPEFEKAAGRGDWLTMARECRMRESDNPGVIPRNVRNALLFTYAGWQVSHPPGDFTQLVFEPTVGLADHLRSRRGPLPLNLMIGLQAALEAMNFDPKGLDGRVGTNTRAALTAYQSTHGLTQTPEVKGIDDVPQETITHLATRLDAAGIGRFP
ncbi:peptidoglycan-binding protein [Streptomyces sp. NPDC003023]|uniref:peptidoglycan-binding domain-containing protein n=1 Tax=Streptomyces sp. NPDC003023 TaxID=3364675 RepID=UPI0036A5DAD1